MGNKEITKAYVKKFVMPVKGEFYYSVQINRIVENNNDVIFCNCGKLCRTSEEVSLFLEQTKKFFSEIVCIDTDELFCVRR